MKKKNKQYFQYGLIVIGIFILGYLGGYYLSLTNFPNNFRVIEKANSFVPREIKEDSFFLKPITISSPLIGSQIGNRTFNICDDGNLKSTIGNSYQIAGSKLTLNSDISSRDRPCGWNNIDAKLTLPIGTLRVNCDLTASETKSGDSASFCLVYDVTGKDIDTITSYIVDTERPIYSNERCKHDDGRELYCTYDENEGVINLEKESELLFVVLTGVGYTGSANGKMEIEFDELEIQIDVYRFDGENCNLIKIKKSEMTENDYLTLKECEKNIHDYTPYYVAGITLVVILGGLILWIRRH